MITGAHAIIYSTNPDADQQPWGRLTPVALPGGGELGIYQPRHVRPPAV